MTATPIPRTLALTLYGDLEVSVIDELPPGRKPVATHVFHEGDRQQAYRLVKDHLDRGQQAYVVYPLVEESEKSDLKAATNMAEELASRRLSGLSCGPAPRPHEGRGQGRGDAPFPGRRGAAAGVNDRH